MPDTHGDDADLFVPDVGDDPVVADAIFLERSEAGAAQRLSYRAWVLQGGELIIEEA